jgi:hypothetical protein
MRKNLLVHTIPGTDIRLVKKKFKAANKMIHNILWIFKI